ncbi:hypothetical protein LRR81_07910 [Metabacillus sp. GX 13764]|uniref:hypothetical protein n=1 Tax=Metabacillus kandeliae TaxID=2900151 RepID=UPI001E5D735F|nr:hypothetical protein [Metabacillus kandeliae]MCD7034156.1 hypothetical protein [Metabacillus kandeliae]
MYNQPFYDPSVLYDQRYYSGYPYEGYRPESFADSPQTPPPGQIPTLPESFSAAPQSGQVRTRMCSCLGKWGLLGLRFQSPFGRDFWFYPTDIRINSVSGYVWQGGRTRSETYRYSQIRNFMCAT